MASSHPRSDGASTTTLPQRPHRTRRPSYKMRENGKPDHAQRVKTVTERRHQRASRIEVLVPTLRQIETRLGRATRRHAPASEERSRSTPRLKSEEQDVKFPFLLQARIKAEIKREEIPFDNAMRDRLAHIGHETVDLDVPQPLLEVTTTRRFMSHTWGGSPSMMFPSISKRFSHGLVDFMYMNPTLDPYAPRWPGAPGLLLRFGGCDGEEWSKTMRVLVRLESKAWQYMGQYALTVAPPLTQDEWNAQSHQLKRMWAIQLSERKTADGYRLRTKIVLRQRLGRVPTSQELAAAVRSKKKFQPGPDEILRECNEGNVVVQVWYMKCVGYDLDFQRRIAAGARTPEPLV